MEFCAIGLFISVHIALIIGLNPCIDRLLLNSQGTSALYDQAFDLFTLNTRFVVPFLFHRSGDLILLSQALEFGQNLISKAESLAWFSMGYYNNKLDHKVELFILDVPKINNMRRICLISMRY